MRESKRTKAQRKAYLDEALAILDRAGVAGRDDDDLMYPFTVQTMAGVLKVKIYPTPSWQSCWTACRFEDVAAARELLGNSWPHRLNPHSGKWNWMGGDNHEGDMQDLKDFEAALQSILVPRETS